MWHMQQVQDATRTGCQIAARAARCRPWCSTREAPGPKQGIWAPVLAQTGSQRSLDVAEEAAHPASQHGWVRSAKGSQDEVFQSQGTKNEKNGRTGKKMGNRKN